MASSRMPRVNELIKRELGAMIEREISPYTDAIVTVQRVRTAEDLRQARVAVSVFGNDEQKEHCLHLLRRSRAVFQEGLGRRVALRYTPVLRFELDTNIEEGDRVLALIRELDAEGGGADTGTSATANGAG